MAKRMKKIGSCIVIVAILMCVSGTVFAGDSGYNADKASNRLDSLEEKFTGHNSSEGGIPFFTNNTIGKSRAATIGDCVGILDASIPMVYLNATQDSVASQDSGNVIILSDISNDTHEHVSVTSCTVYVAIDDDTCVGYEVYLDGVYQFTEGQGKTPDGFCSFSVTEGTHTLEIRKNGCAASKTHNFLCGVSYTWVSMPDYWCEGGGGDCDNPPTVYFDETSYYEGDKVQITVSTIHSSVYYEIKDCSGTVRKTGYTCGGTISYTIPDGSTSSCCYWTICFYWDEGGGPIGPAEAGGNVTTESYQCTKCYNFYVCPDTCDAYVEIEDKVCFGYEVYVDGVLQFTEGQGTTPDGYCSFTVSEGYHTIEIRKDGCSEIVYSYYYFQCNGQYKKILQNYWCDCNKADLIIQDIAWSPNSPELEDTVTFTVTVKNIGVGTADQSTVKYYINNQYVDLDTIPSLNPGATSTRTFTWTADSCGNVIVKAIADANHNVQECDETNNVKQESIEIDGPDLIILDITWPSGPVCLDTPVTATVKVKNQGDCTAGASTVKYYVDNQYVGYDSIPVLGPGATSTQTFTWTASSCGNVPVKAVADANNDVKECYEYNNEKQKDIEIDGPDLIIQDITWPTGPVCLDTPVTLTVKVKNQGDCLAGASTVKYYVDNKYVDSDTISSLSSGATSTQTFTWTASSCGNVPVKAVADANNAVHECDEYNNEKQKSIEVDGPDLIIQDVTWPTGPVCLDTPVTLTVKVKNQGDCTAGASTVKYYVDNQYVDFDTISSLSSGATSTQTFTWTASNCGNVPVKAVADANNAVHECDEANNDKQKSIEVDGPDLIIQDVTWPTGPVCLDKPVTVTVKVKNQGDCTAGSFTVKYYVDNQYNGSYTISSLKYGSTSTQTFSWTPDTCGNHNIKVVADANNAVHECDETNNEKQKSIEVDGPDLIIQDITWPTGPVCLDKPVTVTVKVKNQGDCVAAGSFTVKYYVDDQYHDSDTITTSLSHGGTSTQTFSWTPDTCGNHNIKVVADANNAVHECDETNNEKQKSIEVNGPDLIIQDVTWPTGSVYISKPVTITVKVKNQGGCTAGSSTIKYYVDNQYYAYDSISNLKIGSMSTQTFSWTPDTCGNHNIKAVADANNNVKECNENNNESFKSVDVKGPDLIVEQITVSSPTTIESKIKFTVVIRNKGNANAGKLYLKCYIDDSSIGNKVLVNGINSGQSITKDVYWTASGCGPHSFKAVADADNDVPECDEENNEKQTSFSVKCPDLIIQSISISPESPAPQQETTFTVVVKNKGDADAGDSTLKCSIGGAGICSKTTGVIPVGSTSSRTCTWTGSGCAEHNFKAAVDAVGNKVKESDETNNEKSRSFSVVDSVKPTITIGSPSNGYTSSSSSITVEGTASDNSGVAKVEVNVNGGEWQQASGTTSWSKTVSLTEGTNTITVKATDICGNSQSTSITVHYNSGNSDPVITSITADPTVVGQGKSSTITVVASDPDGDALSYSYDPTGGEISSGGGDDEVTWTADTFNIPPDHDLIFRVYVTVSDGEKNASGSVDITVTSEDKPDLIIQDITWTPANPKKGDSVSIKVITKNVGNADAKASHVKLSIKGKDLPTASVGAISVGSTESKTITWTADSCGNTAVKASADANGAITESDERNNDLTEIIPLKCPDLVITDIRWEPENPKPSDEVKFFYTVKNQGKAGTAPKEFNNRLYIDGESWDISARSSLAAGVSKDRFFTHKWKAVKGSHKIKVEADSGKEIDEGDENNVKKKDIVIGEEATIDLIITGIEVTQAIQNVNNDVPLIEGKDTFVRVYMKTNSKEKDIFDIKGNLIGFRNSKAIGEIENKNKRNTIKKESGEGRPSINEREEINNGLIFKLPGDWLSGEITIKVEIEPDPRYTLNNICSIIQKCEKKLEFNKVSRFNIAFIPIHHKPSNTKPNIADFEEVYLDFIKLYPLTKNDISIEPWNPLEIDYNPTNGNSMECPTAWVVKGNCAWRLLMEIKFLNSYKETENTVAYGLVDGYLHYADPNRGGYRGATFGGTGKSFGKYATWGISDRISGKLHIMEHNLMAHEIGHDFGRDHVDCPKGIPDDIDDGWPYPGDECQLAPKTSTGFWGFDVEKTTVIDPEICSDFMSYRNPNWVSDYTYTALFDLIKEGGILTSSAKYSIMSMSEPMEIDMLLVNGYINISTDEAIFENFYHVTKIPQPSSSIGQYRIELQSTTHEVLVNHSFDIFNAEGFDVVGFVEAVPYNPSTARIVLKHNTTELASVTISDNAPKVTVISPNGGETLSGIATVTWQASDLDADELHYIVEYSPDNGGTWHTLAIDLIETRYLINTAYLQGSIEGLIRITASDGVNSGSDVSDSVFTVLEKPPEVAIVNPANGITIIAGTHISFSGAGYDLEDGMLDDSVLTWISDQNGILGTGEDLWTRNLTRGMHTITLMGEDSDGNRATDQITISVIDSATIDTPKGTVRLSATDGVIIGACRVNESLLPALSDVKFPFGVFAFNISELSNGQIVNVTLELPQELPSDAKYWKFGRKVGGTTPHWYEIPMVVSADNRTVTIRLTDGGVGDDDMTANGVIVDAGAPGVALTHIFDTKASANPYPSLSGTHKGTIMPIQTIEVQKLYTYPCAGTGGHTKTVRIYGSGKDESASWEGYGGGDWNTLTFNSSFTLEAGKTYNYVIKTGSYPQIHHTKALKTEYGWINCTSFVDVNGKEYKDWIPAIKMC